jgi:hypothetical protein
LLPFVKPLQTDPSSAIRFLEPFSYASPSPTSIPARAIERHRGRVDEEALSDAMARYTLQRARERLGLPRVSFV